MRLFLKSLPLTLACALTLHAQGPSKALISIDLEEVIGEIDPKIYGNFTEHLGRCIYGGIVDFGSPLSDADGIRKDVLQAAKDLGVTILRWPGGNFASGYHWQDGIGPKGERPKRLDLAWGAVEPNLLGTDEFLGFCEKLGAEPYICVNLGTGTWDEARSWVEYCNRDSGTALADLRRRNGRTKPYDVKYWALGNEMDGDWQMGHRSAEDYGKFALEAAKLMKWTDPTIKLVACGSSNFSRDWIDWNRTVLNYLRGYADYIALHTYLGNRGNDYEEFLASPLDVEERITIVEGLIREVLTTTHRATPIFIAFDEYNVWYRTGTKEGLEETYNLEDALVIAQILNVFVRHADIVKIANMAQLVNVIAPIRAEKNGLWLQTIYAPLQLFARYCRGVSLAAHVTCDTYETASRKAVPFLDVSAVFDSSSGQVMIGVVNRRRDSAVEAELRTSTGRWLAGLGRADEVSGPDIKSRNGPSEQIVKAREREFSLPGRSSFSYHFPPHSFTLIRAKVIQ